MKQPTIRRKFGPLLHVTWEDSALHSSGWTDLSDLNADDWTRPVLIETVGRKVMETKTAITLAQSISDVGGPGKLNFQGSGFMTIPKGCIVRTRHLAVK